MEIEVRKYTRAVKAYDRLLYCAPNDKGTLCIFRKLKRFVPVVIGDDFKLLNLVEDKYLVFALTDTWSVRGAPRAWGIDFVLDRLREIDTQARERLFEEREAEERRLQESKDRHIRNEAEAWAADNRRAFAKAFDDINTTSVSMDEPIKRLRDRSIKNGNY